ncbi:MAG: tetratricopeptide repeat protein [Planctomycetaceae bacterium]
MAGRDTPQPASNDPAPQGPVEGRSRRRKPSAWFGSLNQLDFDIDFFERLLPRRPDSVEVLRVLAELVSRKGLVARAVELDRRLVEILPDDFLARYNLACSLARAGRPDEAIDSLSRAILLGYDDLSHMEADADLESLRDHPDFRALVDGD